MGTKDPDGHTAAIFSLVFLGLFLATGLGSLVAMRQADTHEDFAADISTADANVAERGTAK